MSISILYQDDYLVVANKPSGLLVHRSPQSSDRVFLLQELRDQLGKFVYPVHRLDRAASGPIAMAFSSEVARKLQENLSDRGTLKEYLALVRGKAPQQGSISKPLTDENRAVRDALTRFERVETLVNGTLLRVWIATGRRHQIRRHLAHLHHHILGDTVYGKGGINRACRERWGLTRLFLHSTRLEFDHPETRERVRAHAPLPIELEQVLVAARGYFT